MAVLTIAGSDSSSGAGIQADLKSFVANGSYGATVITSITSQNTKGVFDIYDLPLEVIKSQFNAVVTDLDIKFIKVGMLNSCEIVELVGYLLKDKNIPFIIDPVMSAKDSTKLLKCEEKSHIKKLIKESYLVTPNIPEASILTGLEILTKEDMKEACVNLEAKNVLLKGGHLVGDELVDVLFYDGEFFEFYHKRVDTKNTHGTGCTLSSAITAHLEQGCDLPTACSLSIEYLQESIKHSYSIGGGNSPVNHFFALDGFNG